MAGEVKVGITSWTDKSLIASGWYPKSVHTAEARLRHYTTQFSVVENDSAYYALPSLHQAEVWVERTPAEFTMNVKAFATMTEHYTDPKRLPVDLRATLSPALRDKARVYPRDLGREMLVEIARRYREALEPLRVGGRLGLILFQYPVWFPFSVDHCRTVASTRTLVPDCRVAVEFRNWTWMSDRNRERTLALLRDEGIVYTCVDEPQGFTSSIPPIAAVTSDLALVRMHGRAAATWNRTAKGASERFRYRYGVDELCEWVPKIEELSRQADTVHVLMNNCYSDYAVTNAAQLRELVETRADPSRRSEAGPRYRCDIDASRSRSGRRSSHRPPSSPAV